METALIKALDNAQIWEASKVLNSIVGTIWVGSATVQGNSWTVQFTLGQGQRIITASYQREAVRVQEAASPRVQYA